jgi:hypothetical protein
MSCKQQDEITAKIQLSLIKPKFNKKKTLLLKSKFRVCKPFSKILTKFNRSRQNS